MTTQDPALTVAVALTLISEKVRFWSDEQRDLLGQPVQPRCMFPERAQDLRQSLLEINEHCRSALQAYDKSKV